MDSGTSNVQGLSVTNAAFARPFFLRQHGVGMERFFILPTSNTVNVLDHEYELMVILSNVLKVEYISFCLTLKSPTDREYCLLAHSLPTRVYS